MGFMIIAEMNISVSAIKILNNIKLFFYLTFFINFCCSFPQVVLLLWIFISYIVPHVADSLVSLTNNIPSYISALQNEIMTKLNNFHLLDESVIDVESIIQKSLTSLKKSV